MLFKDKQMRSRTLHSAEQVSCSEMPCGYMHVGQALRIRAGGYTEARQSLAGQQRSCASAAWRRQTAASTCARRQTAGALLLRRRQYWKSRKSVASPSLSTTPGLQPSCGLLLSESSLQCPAMPCNAVAPANVWICGHMRVCLRVCRPEHACTQYTGTPHWWRAARCISRPRPRAWATLPCSGCARVGPSRAPSDPCCGSRLLLVPACRSPLGTQHPALHERVR